MMPVIDTKGGVKHGKWGRQPSTLRSEAREIDWH